MKHLRNYSLVFFFQCSEFLINSFFPSFIESFYCIYVAIDLFNLSGEIHMNDSDRRYQIDGFVENMVLSLKFWSLFSSDNGFVTCGLFSGEIEQTLT